MTNQQFLIEELDNFKPGDAANILEAVRMCRVGLITETEMVRKINIEETAGE